MCFPIFEIRTGVQLAATFGGLVIAHTLIALPWTMRLVCASLVSANAASEEAARSLGANSLQTFFLVTLPQIRFALVTSAVLAFLTSFDEVVIALFISGGDNSTLTRNMFLALRDQIDPTIAAISTLMIVVTTVLLAISQLFGRTRDG